MPKKRKKKSKKNANDEFIQEYNETRGRSPQETVELRIKLCALRGKWPEIAQQIANHHNITLQNLHLWLHKSFFSSSSSSSSSTPTINSARVKALAIFLTTRKYTFTTEAALEKDN